MGLQFGSVATATSALLTIVSGTADAFGDYVELISSTTEDSKWVILDLCAVTTNGGRSSIVEIAVGAAGAETGLFKAYIPHCTSSESGKTKIAVPASVASGSRVSIRVKSNVQSTSVYANVCLASYDMWGTSTQNEFIGENGSKGVVIDPGATINTKGSWVEITPATSHDYDYIILFMGNDQNAADSNFRFLVDVATGSAGSETVLLENIFQSSDTLEGGHGVAHPFFVSIPSGTRISARAQCSGNDATDRLLDISILGVNMNSSGGGAPITYSYGHA